MGEEHFGQIIKLCGISLGKAGADLKDVLKDNKEVSADISELTGEVHIRLAARSENEKDAKKALKKATKDLKVKFSDKIYTTEEDVSLEKAVVDLLIANKLSLSTAESCTGGMLSSKLVGVPGVSDVFKSGVVTYSNKAKHKLLGVKNRTLEKYGAVSEETASEMAKGVAALLKSDVGVGITGIAGPDGGTKDKPVGLVYIGVAVGKDIKVKKCLFEGDRENIRNCSVTAALALMRRQILEYYSKVTFG